MPGKQSKVRYRMMIAEVSDKVQEALKTGVETNPFPAEAKRHARFERKLNSIKAADWLLEG